MITDDKNGLGFDWCENMGARETRTTNQTHDPVSLSNIIWSTLLIKA
jgi:hypothetical protein